MPCSTSAALDPVSGKTQRYIANLKMTYGSEKGRILYFCYETDKIENVHHFHILPSYVRKWDEFKRIRKPPSFSGIRRACAKMIKCVGF